MVWCPKCHHYINGRQAKMRHKKECSGLNRKLDYGKIKTALRQTRLNRKKPKNKSYGGKLVST